MDFEKLGKEHAVTLYPALSTKYGWFTTLECDPTGMDEYVALGDPVTVTFKINDPRQHLVDALHDRIKKIRAESENEVRQIEDQITRLLALEHK